MEKKISITKQHVNANLLAICLKTGNKKTKLLPYVINASLLNRSLMYKYMTSKKYHMDVKGSIKSKSMVPSTSASC